MGPELDDNDWNNGNDERMLTNERDREMQWNEMRKW